MLKKKYSWLLNEVGTVCYLVEELLPAEDLLLLDLVPEVAVHRVLVDQLLPLLVHLIRLLHLLALRLKYVKITTHTKCFCLPPCKMMV